MQTNNPINFPPRGSNDRVAGFCQAVLWKDRLTTYTGGEDSPTDSFVLKGTQSVGVSRTVDRENFVDIGRYGREYGRYGKTQFTINITRVLTKSEDFFYNITDANLTTGGGQAALDNYLNGHTFSTATNETIGVDGVQDRFKNWDITLMYGRDDLSYMNRPFPPPEINGDTGINHTTYRACLLTNISYTIPINGAVTEELTFISYQYTQNDETDPALWTNLNNVNPSSGEPYDGFPQSRPEEPAGDNTQIIENPDWPGIDVPNPTRIPQYIVNPDYVQPPFGSGKEKTFKRQDLSISECLFPVEVIEAFQIEQRKQYDLKSDAEFFVMGLQQIEINIEINYSDPINIGSWRGDGGTDVDPAVYSRTMTNTFRQIELPVGVSCTFTGVIGAQYFSKLEYNVAAGAGYDAFNSTGQNHEITDTYHTAGAYGDETKNANYDLADPKRFVEQYKTDREILIVAWGENPTGTAPEKWQWNLGKKNYITSFEVTGGDADGGNVEVSMSFQNDWSEFFLFKNEQILEFEPPSVDPPPEE